MTLIQSQLIYDKEHPTVQWSIQKVALDLVNIYIGKKIFTLTSCHSYISKHFKFTSTKICVCFFFLKSSIPFIRELYFYSFVFALAAWKLTDKACLITVIFFKVFGITLLSILLHDSCSFILALMILFYGSLFFV